MKGYPSTLSSKEDYLYVKDNFLREDWEQDFKNLLETRFDWFFDHYLEDGETVEETDELKLIAPQENSEDKRTAVYVWKESSTAHIYRLGFTVEEVQTILGL